MNSSRPPKADFDHEIDSDPVWDLLENASKTEASPFFSRNVLREIRQIEDQPASIWQQFLSAVRQPVVILPVTTAIAVAVVIFATDSSNPRDFSEGTIASDSSASEPIFDPTQEVEELSNFSELMAVADISGLSDASIAALLY